MYCEEIDWAWRIHNAGWEVRCVPAACVNVPVPVYGDVPPVALIVTVELPPLHKIAVVLDEATKAAGSAMVTLVTAVQPLASVTVKL